MENLDLIPPTIALLLNEDLGDLNNVSDFAKRYQRIHTEVARQAEWSLDQFRYFNESEKIPNSLVITASAGLNPFSAHGICSARDCRLATARQVARTLGLYADTVVVPDSFSPDAALGRPPSTEAAFEILRNHVLVLRELEPLIRAGIIKFRRGESRFCSSCHQKFQTEVTEGVERFVDQWNPDIHTRIINGSIVVEIRNADDGVAAFVHPLTRSEKKELKTGAALQDIGRRAYLYDLTRNVQRTLLDLRFSERMKSPLFSTARRQLLSVKALDYTQVKEDDLGSWEAARSVVLPWIADLTVEQVLRLRSEAAKALPAFRERFVRKVSSPESGADSVKDTIDELRYEAVELETELRALNPASEAMFRNVNGALGITASVYGFAAGAVPAAAALGGLITLLGYLHTASRKDAQEKELLVSKPAYVLLKAKEITGHAPSQA